MKSTLEFNAPYLDRSYDFIKDIEKLTDYKETIKKSRFKESFKQQSKYGIKQNTDRGS